MDRRDFWSEVLAMNGSVTPFVKRRVLGFGVFAAVIWIVVESLHFVTGSGVAHYEIIGVVLTLLLMLRTNAGYDRWYEGRKLWGGIVNQSRNLAQIGVAYGPKDKAWRNQFLRWTAAFSHVSRHSLRNERNIDDLRPLLGDAEVEELAAAQHMPSYVGLRLSTMLREAVDRGQMEPFAMLQAERERSLLIDHLGGCERISKTPLAKVFSIKIRRFIFLYLVALPFGIVEKTGSLTALIVMLVAYPLLSLDQIGIELEQPFSRERLSHLPLDEISANIQGNVMALADDDDVDDETQRRRELVA